MIRSIMLVVLLILTLTTGSPGVLGPLPARSADASSVAMIVSDGVAKAHIVVAPDAPRTVQHAARELSRVIEKMTGARLSIVTEANDDLPIRLYVGQSAATQSLGLNDATYEHGGFRIVSGSNWLAFLGGDKDYMPVEPWGHNPRDGERVLEAWDKITGSKFGNPFLAMYRKHDARDTGLWEFDLDNAGSFQAVTSFLRSLGARWYMPGELGEFIPDKDSIALPVIDTTAKPDFALRNIYQFGTNFFTSRDDEIRWQLQLGTNQGMGLVGFGPNVSVAHGIKNVIARDEMKQAHPLMYRLYNGKRVMEHPVPCLQSEELVTANVQYLRDMFDHYDMPMVSVMPTDGFTRICQCDLCVNLETPERGRRGQLSDYVWQYVARVARELQKSHPDKKLHCLAYTTYQLPPVNIAKLPSNVVVGIAQNRSYFRLPEQKKIIEEIRQGWLEKITSGVPMYQYEYYLQEWPSRPWQGLPVLYPRLIVDDLRSLKGISMGDYIEAYRPREPQPTTMLNIYITARFLWDADQDLDAMLDEYFKLMFEDAQAPMRAFYTLAEQRWSDLQAEDIQKLTGLLEQASEAAGDTDSRKRIALIQAYVQDGFDRRMAQVREPDVIALTYYDTQGLDADADPQLVPKRPLVDVVTRQPSEAEVAGSVALAWTGQALWVRVVYDEPLPELVRALAPKNQDAAIFRDDTIVIAVGRPDEDPREIHINAKGIWAGIDRARQGLDGLGWNPQIEVTLHTQAQQHIVEVIMPASALAMDVPSKDQPWLVNVSRVKLRDSRLLMSAAAATGTKAGGLGERMLRVYVANDAMTGQDTQEKK